MTITKWTAAGGLAIALFIGLLVGHYATPAKIVERERIVTVESESSAHWGAYIGRTETISRIETVYNTRTEWRSDGTVIATTEAASKTDARTSSETQQIKIEVREVIKYQDREKLKIVEEKPNWLISGRAGLHPDGQPVYGGSVQYRWGPVYLGPWVQGSELSTRGLAVGLAASVMF